MSSSQSGTIDGVSYASSTYVYDTHGDGIVTDILYYDQTGKQVADQTIFAWPPFTTSAPIANSDGTFSVKVTPPPGGHGNDPTYLLETFSSTGIWIREDDYGPVYKDPNNPDAGISGYTETAHIVVNAVGAGSSGSLNGVYYDTVMRTYTASGRLAQTSYFNDLGGSHDLVATQYAPNPNISLSPTGTATAGTPDTPLYAGLRDP